MSSQQTPTQTLQSLLQSLKTHQQTTQSLKSLTNRQSMRSLRLPSIFKFAPSEAEMFDQIYGRQVVEPYQEYSRLVSKQVRDGVGDIGRRIQGVRVAIGKVLAEAKRTKEQPVQAAKQYQTKTNELLEHLTNFWQAQSFLMANYRLDIAAKEVEQWNNGLNYKNTHNTEKQIDNLFR